MIMESTTIIILLEMKFLQFSIPEFIMNKDMSIL